MSARSRRGFTLLEVLAAVAVLALVYTALARAAMQGLAHEGDASRRLRASLLADQALAEVEAQLAAGVAPTPGITELEEEEFAISVEVRPFDLGAFALEAGEAAAAVLGEPTGVEGARPDGPSFQLLTAQPGAPAPLFEIDVRVRWLEGSFEQEATRTSFAADPARVSAALEGLSAAASEEGAEDDGEGEDLGGDDGPDAEPAPMPPAQEEVE
jgi:prepilin-type N-terminal cleavage/methylation domain-containing protein